jgi:2-polyprenyl-3-methyl-5-hydroxy-6-metoxy-1,4-benzoquinol methylase
MSGIMRRVLEKLTLQKMVCPWWLCYTFDNPIRRLLHNPEVILCPYVHSGSTVIDIGAGMGYFSIPLARLVGPAGHVTAIDVQAKMLAALAGRARKHGLSERIKTYLAQTDSLGNHSKVDFIIAFWMVHEVPDQRVFFSEIFGLLKPKGLFLMAEPVFHVPEKRFMQTVQTAEGAGFIVKETPRIRVSRSVVFTRNKHGPSGSLCGGRGA